MTHGSSSSNIEYSDPTYNVQNKDDVQGFSDVIAYINAIAKPVVSLAHMNRSTGMEGERNPVEISSLMARAPAPLLVFSITERYTRSMLECMVGYPLYEPEPFSELSTEYTRQGVNVGDVGFIREDGAFDFLFNICPTQDMINPPNLPDGFSLHEHLKTREIGPLSSETCFFPQTVIKSESGEYTCKGSEGAVLVLPEGAVQEEAINMGPFEGLAKRHAVKWYEYTKARGRSISNGSLYLVTSITKCNQWGIAVFDRPSEPADSGQALTFVTTPLGWKGLGALTTKVADLNQTDTPNQCVFLRGYKIMVRQDVFDNLLKPQQAQRTRSAGVFGFLSRILTPLAWGSTVKKGDEVILQANFNSSPLHPSDFLNTELLSQNPNAKVALTHDDVWRDLLRDNFPKLDEVRLVNVARSYTSIVDEHDCVSLAKISGLSDVFGESGHPIQGMLPEQIQDAINDRNPDISIPSQAPFTPRTLSIGHSPTGRDAQRRAIQSESDALIIQPTVDRPGEMGDGQNTPGFFQSFLATVRHLVTAVGGSPTVPITTPDGPQIINTTGAPPSVDEY